MTRPHARPRPPASVLFVCLGNICRSPTAEGVLAPRSREPGLAASSESTGPAPATGTSATPPDRRATAAAAARHRSHVRGAAGQGDDLDTSTRSSRWTARTFARLEALRPPQYAGHLGLFLDFAPDAGLDEVPDPVLRRARRTSTACSTWWRSRAPGWSSGCGSRAGGSVDPGVEARGERRAAVRAFREHCRRAAGARWRRGRCDRRRRAALGRASGPRRCDRGRAAAPAPSLPQQISRA